MSLFVEQRWIFFWANATRKRAKLSRVRSHLRRDYIARDGLAAVLTALGCFGEAAREYQTLLTADPANVDTRCNFAECLLRARDRQQSVAMAQLVLARAPYHQFALALWGIGLRQLYDTRESALNDYENFVQVYDLEPPDGFCDMQSFNEALKSSLAKLHGDRREQIDQTSRFGTQTLETFFPAQAMKSWSG